MNNIYSCRILCSIPVSLESVGAAIGRALDPDLGGDKSFTKSNDAPDTELTMNTLCTCEFADAVPYLLADPAALLSTIERDRDLRWLVLNPKLPTLKEVATFCTTAKLTVSKPGV